MPALENITMGGLSATALKKLYGARLGVPSASSVEIQPIGRGAMIALKGSCGSRARSRAARLVEHRLSRRALAQKPAHVGFDLGIVDRPGADEFGCRGSASRRACGLDRRRLQFGRALTRGVFQRRLAQRLAGRGGVEHGGGARARRDGERSGQFSRRPAATVAREGDILHVRGSWVRGIRRRDAVTARAPTRVMRCRSSPQTAATPTADHSSSCEPVATTCHAAPHGDGDGEQGDGRERQARPAPGAGPTRDRRRARSGTLVTCPLEIGARLLERGVLALGERPPGEPLLRHRGAGVELEPHFLGRLARLGEHAQRLIQAHGVALGGVELPAAVPRRQQVDEPQEHGDEHDHSPAQHLPTHGDTR